MTDSDLGRTYPAPNFGRTYPAPNFGRTYPAPNLGREYPAPNLGRETTVAPAAIVYLLGPFQFILDVPAPIPSPYTEYLAVGSLKIIDTGARVTISSGRLNEVAGGADGDPVLFGNTLLTRTIGRAVLGTQMMPNASQHGYGVGWSNVQASIPLEGFLFRNTNVIQIRAAAFIDTIGWLPAINYETAVVLRSAGAFYFVRVSGVWVLVWIDAASAGPNVYPMVGGSSGAWTADNLRVIDLGTYDARFATDYGLALNRSTFTAANGTALTAITPEVGSAWTQQNGVFEVQSNRLGQVSGAGTLIATVNSTSDAVLEATINPGTYVGDHGFCLRYTDANNYWIVILRQSDSTMRIYERAAGVSTFRASVAVAGGIVASTDYRVVVVLEGSTITAYLNNANKVTYASATSNQTATKHGAVALAYDPTPRWDDFIIWPRTLSLPAGI